MPLADEHDCLLLDLDGTVVRGSQPIDGAVDIIASVTGRTLFVTNNASRSADEVATHLQRLGFGIEPGDVVTSAQSAARLLASDLTPGSRVLVVGTDALAAELIAVGLQAVRSWDDGPVAVVQGHSPRTGWADLAEAALAIQAGVPWVATNLDVTFPTERGLVPGNGSLVAALQATSGRKPTVVGKPHPWMLRDALARGDFRSPLVVGDRIDTDIAGAHAAGLPSMLVLSGVSTAHDLVHAPPDRRPTYVAPDLRALACASAGLRIGAQPHWHVDSDGVTVTVTSTADPLEDSGLSAVRAVAAVVWGAACDQPVITIRAGDPIAHGALERWHLLG